MTLPSSGPLSLSDIQTEFGGSNPISLSEYYAGGAYVPAGTTGTFGAVPSSGTISLRNFYGTTKYLDSQTVTVGIFDLGGGYGTYYGYFAGVTGAISDGTSNMYSGATIGRLFWYSLTSSLTFTVQQPNLTKAWTTMVVNGVSFSTAPSSSTDSTSTTWTWSGVSNPFGYTAGVNVTCTWI